MTAFAPDTVGYNLPRAREVLEETGWEIDCVNEIRPPAPHRVPPGPLRVVQQRPVGPARIVLVVAHQLTIDEENIG